MQLGSLSRCAQIIYGYLLFSILSFTQLAWGFDVSNRPDIQAFINNTAKTHHFNKHKLTELFSKAELKRSVIKSITRTWEAKPWHDYRSHFMDPARIKNGLKFWASHEKTLINTQKKYGVPPNVIVAIIGVESRYGKRQGTFRVIDALSTLAFNYPPREKFFRSELIQYLLMTRDLKLDPLALKGSYAGAIGMPQFMPDSYRIYAVDYNKKGPIDLTKNVDDVIASVGNYLNKHGWKRNQAVAMRANVTGEQYEKIPKFHLTPILSIDQLSEFGVSPTRKVANDKKAIVLKLSNPHTSEYWLGFHNFSVLGHYNSSSFYVMAVYELGQKIKSLRHKHAKPKIKAIAFA